ncbi:flagellar motor protein MotB [Demequina sp.]|uniref:flagellar motor protein MotB n=1 Tax=Demequina sp. TaxID=2050685 RepID=UPI003A8A28AC
MSSYRRGRAHAEEHENHERWAVSYADMMTVLVALFIVLYAISTVDQVKFEELRQSLAAGFGDNGTSIAQGSTGALTGLEAFEIAPDFTALSDESAMASSAQGEAHTPAYLEAAREYEQLADMLATLSAAVEAEGLESYVRFSIDDRGLVIGLVGSSVFFSADSATLTDVAQRVVTSLAGPLRDRGRELSVEGHANLLPSSKFDSNWELSSARATQVLRHFVEAGGIEPHLIGATGYGDARPQEEGDNDAALATNRRVDIVVRSEASEAARAILPTIVASLEAGDLTPQQLREQIVSGYSQKGQNS